MKKFLLLYMAPKSAQEQMASADADAGKKGMDMWMAWFQKAGSAIVDGGSPTQHAATIGQSEAGIKGHVGGYSILQAENLDEVKKLLENHPHMMMPGGASIEVLELLPMPGM